MSSGSDSDRRTDRNPSKISEPSLKDISRLIHILPDAVMVVDAGGRMVLWNPPFEKLFGYGASELGGRKIETLIPARYRESHQDERSRFQADPKARFMGNGRVFFGLQKDGREVPLEISLSTMTAGDQRVSVAVIRDLNARDYDLARTRELSRLNQSLQERIAEQSSAEQALRSERDLSEQYLDSAPVIFVVLERDGAIRRMNRRGREILECQQEDVVGKNWFDEFLPDSERNSVRAAFERIVAGDLALVEYFENTVRTRNGKERTISWHNGVLRDESGQVTGTLSSGLDVTEHRELERRVRLAERLAAVGEFTSGLAHEIGTPLSVVAGRAEYMYRKMPPEDPLRENLTRIIAQIERITKLVQQLLSFTRRKALDLRPIRLVGPVGEALGLFEYQFKKYGITAHLDAAEDLPLIFADPDQIQQVCMNIVLNAVQAMPEGGRLDVGIHRTVPRDRREDPLGDRYLRLEFADSGRGIRPDVLPRIFEPFVSTKEPGQGTGLGLAVCYGIVHDHGGWIDVKSRVNEGSRFSVFLPVSGPQEPPESAGHLPDESMKEPF